MMEGREGEWGEGLRERAQWRGKGREGSVGKEDESNGMDATFLLLFVEQSRRPGAVRPGGKVEK